MAILLSELYGKEIITNEGKKIGLVEDAILDFESGKVANLLLIKAEQLTRSDNTAMLLAKNSVKYERVKNVSESIIVGSK
ncbi:MAG: PRC-barrel domain-containing protein [Candidatus Marsarchaeota archaeon]|jgi:sporulation protein YlmC with PRC-barrel domain|nr:PRC-barrel domain-containing protein [Candidatus Marsarchaeota archaeon]MCL5111585.1 PRC-barrel domain-containing protein [Candidatus Marsarchaeota archaeon]